MSEVLSFNHVSFGYPTDNYEICHDLSFRVESGEFTALIGASGGGKSTLFRLINHFLVPSAGQILVSGQDVATGTQECGYMPQHDLLFPWLTIEENVALPARIKKKKKKERLAQADDLLARVGLAGAEKKYPHELSGGMRQRAAFARTLCTGSDLLLLDEPFSALDSITRMNMQEWLLQQWKQWNKTILFITHDVEEAIFLSGRILVLTGRPATSLLEVKVPLPAQRTRDMMRDPEIEKLQIRLVDLLRQEAARAEEPGSGPAAAEGGRT